MKHTKNILKSLLITVMALSLLAVSCKKDEGGSKPTDPTPTITAENITEGFKALGNALAIDVVKFDFTKFTASKSEVEIKATESSDQANKAKIQAGLEALKITVKGANVKLSNIVVPEVNTATSITMNVTITPDGNNTFAEDVYSSYKVQDKSVVFSLKLSTADGSKNWNEAQS